VIKEEPRLNSMTPTLTNTQQLLHVSVRSSIQTPVCCCLLVECCCASGLAD